MQQSQSRRDALKAMGVTIAAGLAAAQTTGTAQAAEPSPGLLLPSGAKKLKELAARLGKAPRRRDFKTVPMILTSADQWDDQALKEVLGYRGGPKQVWDHTDLAGPWLNLMRNSLNAQVWSFKHPDFLCISATHGMAHLALYDEAGWEKYQLAKLTGDKFKTNAFIKEKPAAAGNPADFENPEGVFSPEDNSITTLERRGVVFLACHNAVWEVAARLRKGDVNPDHLSIEQMAADLTNHLLPHAVLTPGVVATIPELQLAGFHYAR